MKKNLLLGAAGVLLASTAAAQNGTDTCTTPTAIGEGSFAFDTTTMVGNAEMTCTSALDMFQDMFWVYTATISGDVTIDTVGSSFDTQLAIFSGTDCTATCVADNDDIDAGAGNFLSRVNLTGVTAGDTFVIQVGGWDAAEFGPGILNIGPTVDPCAGFVDDAFEDNDDCLTATPITPGSYTGLAVIDPDADFYSINVPAGDILTFTETFDSNDTDYNAYDSCGGLQIVTGVLGGFTYQNTSGAAQDVIIEAYQWTGATDLCSNYDFDVSLSTPLDCGTLADDAFEDNDDCATATPVSDGTYSSLSVFKTDKDHFSFCVADGATVNCDILFATATADLDFFLRDAAAVECGTGNGANELADGFSTSDNETLSWTNTTGADLDVVLEVNVWDSTTNGDCNTYDLIISGAGCGPTSDGTPFCDPMDANSTGLSTTLTGTLGTGVESGLRLEASNGVPSEFGYFLIGTGVDDPGIVISNGRLCLAVTGGNQFGRYNFGTTTNSIGAFDAAGDFQNLVGTATSNGGYGYDVATSNPLGGTIMSGESWHFQLWHRDTPAGAGTSTFSNGLTITFP